jgi:hypothetical protein
MFSNIINMEKYLEFLPEDIVNKISLYNSHPIADLFKKEFKDDLDLHFNHYRKSKSFDDIILFAYIRKTRIKYLVKIQLISIIFPSIRKFGPILFIFLSSIFKIIF